MYPVLKVRDVSIELLMGLEVPLDKIQFKCILKAF